MRDNALDVTTRIFEITGARSATKTQGFDRFWRNVGHWYLNGDYPEPGIYQ